MLLAQGRWLGAFLILLPFAWPHLVRERQAVLGSWRVLTLLALSGITAFNTIQYFALTRTTAMNVLLLQSAMPLLIAAWAYVLYRDRLSADQVLGIGLSLVGVVIIVSRGQPAVLAALDLNRGDLWMLVALAVYAFYSALLMRRPQIHWLTFLAVTIGWGAFMLMPVTLLEALSGARPEWSLETLLILAYVILFPSLLAYLCFNRGVELVGPNRAGPFFHLIPFFGAVLAILLLGERFQAFHALGSLLILSGVVMAGRRQKVS